MANSRVGAMTRALGAPAGTSTPPFEPRQSVGEHQTIGHRLAGAGAGGNQQVSALGLWFEHGGLDRRQVGIAAIGKRLGQRGVDVFGGASHDLHGQWFPYG